MSVMRTSFGWIVRAWERLRSSDGYASSPPASSVPGDVSASETCRNAVLARDEGCIAPMLDKDAGPCYDRWGMRFHFMQRPKDLEIDYVHHPDYVRHVDPEAHVALCPGHHRGTGPNAGRQWATSHRALLREYLYGERVLTS